MPNSTVQENVGVPERRVSAPKVLVVDDDPLNQYIISQSLDQIGLEVRSAETGERALELLEDPKSTYEVVVLDRMMPGICGVEVLRRIKSVPRFARLPVVMQTAAASPEQVREGLAAGAYYYLSKPFEPGQLQTIVRAALSEAGARRAIEWQRCAYTDTLELLDEARFSFRTIEEAYQLAALLSAMCPDPDTVLVGLSELLLNAVEHGNLGIMYAEKAHLRRADAWESEVARRLALPEYRDKRAQVALSRRTDLLIFTIADQGEGFDWRRYIEFDPERACDPNGRGIALARSVSFARLEYRDPGNIVEAVVSLVRATERHAARDAYLVSEDIT